MNGKGDTELCSNLGARICSAHFVIANWCAVDFRFSKEGSAPKVFRRCSDPTWPLTEISRILDHSV